MSTVPTITANLVFPDVTHGQTQFNNEMNTYHQQTILMVDEMVDGVIPGINVVSGEVNAYLSETVQYYTMTQGMYNTFVAYANPIMWVSGTTYAVNDVRVSPTDFQNYRRKTAGAGTTDPNLDTTNWVDFTTSTHNPVFTGGVAIGVDVDNPMAKLHIEDGLVLIGSSQNTSKTNTLISSYGYRLGGTTYGNCSIRSTYNNSSNSSSLEFYTASSGLSSSEKYRITGDGELIIGKTTATANGGDLQVSRGITFPATQVPCSDPNTLDDYEKGFWTCGMANATVTQTSIAQYTKIGNLCHCSFDITITAIGTGNGYILIGLPFRSNADNLATVNIMYVSGLATAVSMITGVIGGSTSSMSIGVIAGTGATSITNPAILTTGSRIAGSFTYLTT